MKHIHVRIMGIREGEREGVDRESLRRGSAKMLKKPA